MLSLVPDEIQSLASLETLAMAFNKLMALPGTMFLMTSLTKLSMIGNPLISPPAELMNLPFPAPLSYLERVHTSRQTDQLDLSAFMLTSVPLVVPSLTNIEEVRMVENRLRDIPGTVRTLRMLQRVDFSENALQSLPQSLKG
ncbi:hypothetical protein T484DRAFT_1778356 [Baffinella frigidus]|nr:hypothetical protein T484DRAFT_1778356 [Cryptophyta sp. CCMP2293]